MATRATEPGEVAPGPTTCPRCHRPADELHYSVRLYTVCCERCFGRVAPPLSPQARRYKPPPPRPRPKPGAFALLAEEVYAALSRAGKAVHGRDDGVFGMGDSKLPLMGYCPACGAGTVSVRLIHTNPPRARIAGCSDGCTPEVVYDAIWPPSAPST